MGQVYFYSAKSEMDEAVKRLMTTNWIFKSSNRRIRTYSMIRRYMCLLMESNSIRTSKKYAKLLNYRFFVGHTIIHSDDGEPLLDVPKLLVKQTLSSYKIKTLRCKVQNFKKH